MRFLVGVLLALSSFGVFARAQFRDLATDHTGQRAWFSSLLALRGMEARVRAANIYAVDSLGVVEVVAASHGDLRRPQVSADGERLVIISEPPAFPGFTCRVCTPGSIVRVPDRQDSEYVGRVEMSRNGRYLLRHSYPYFGPAGQVELIDLDTDDIVPWSVSGFQSTGPAPKVADDGSALVSNGLLWVLRRDSTFDFVNAPDFGFNEGSPFWSPPMFPWVTFNAAGDRVLYHRTTQPPSISLLGPRGIGKHCAVSRRY